MTSTQFVFWLQGYFELANTNEPLTPEQVKTIKNHLKLVFLHEIDPSYSDDPTVQKIFQNIHDGKKPLEGLEIKVKPQPTNWHSGSSNPIVKC